MVLKFHLTRNIFHEKLKDQTLANLIIFGFVFVFSIQALLYIFQFSVNVPVKDDWVIVSFFFKVFYLGEPTWTWIQDIFKLQINEHRVFFPSLIFLTNATLSSWNITAQMYFSWSLIGVSLISFYLLLKKTNSKLVWSLIPISFVIYSPIHGLNFLQGSLLVWFLVVTCFFWSIFFLNNPRNSYFIFSVILGIVASFSELLGLLIWPIGILSIIFQKEWKRRHLFLWSAIALIVFFIYFYDWSQPSSNPIILSPTNLGEFFSVFFAYIGSPFLMEDKTINVGIGFVIFVIFTTILGYFLLKERNNIINSLPWFQIGLFGILSALAVGLGRQSMGLGNATAIRYVTVSELTLISTIILLSFVILIKKEKIKNLKTKFLLIGPISGLFLIGTILLTSSYFEGWERGHISQNQRSLGLECMLDPNFEYKCPYVLFHSGVLKRLSFDITLLQKDAKILQKLKLGPFTEERIIPKDDLLNKENWSNMESNLQVYGAIGQIQKKSISGKSFIHFNKEQTDYIEIIGWAAVKESKVNAVYFLIDEKIDGRVIYGYIREDVARASYAFPSEVGWIYFVNIQSLSEGCHDLAIRIVVDKKFGDIESNSQICIE